MIMERVTAPFSLMTPTPFASPLSLPQVFRRALTFLAIAFGLLASAAHAANITKTFSFVATNFSGGPETRVTGSFTVNFDPAVSVTDQTAGITNNTFSIPYAGNLQFTYVSTTQTLTIGAGADGNTFNVPNGVNDFQLNIRTATTTPVYSFVYGRVGYNTAIFTSFAITPGDIVSGGWVNGTPSQFT
jgi:hypothetical protein